MADRDPGVPNEFDLDPQMALDDAEVSAEPPAPVVDPEDPDHVEPAPHAVPAPEDAGR
ncbi:hypothetical protein SAMN05660209_03425 [Geodermatophilus africanus]|uniref:Uncharacterized protein n=1 Tax=Geodermatophilus africanus TaxID=1137993 RepID=A0A1H3LNG5_9ACTN|nr:hypothetical protein [Geodermatophilus africanus]SDY66087.1 hypothetical protein SAMN05660209_03425 [Geodermatophilus africanus]